LRKANPMSDDKSKVTDKAGEIAKNIWLAGVGAYGKAVEDAQDRIEKAMEPPKLFRDLVKAGTALEEDARGALEASTAARHSVEDRINKVRDNFNNQRPARVEDVAALAKKVDQLSRKVDKLTRALANQETAKPAPGKAIAKTKRKPATRKAPAKKSSGSSRSKSKPKS
jgi:polyhydroxyalkanoate synthesis regulator phasin